METADVVGLKRQRDSTAVEPVVEKKPKTEAAPPLPLREGQWHVHAGSLHLLFLAPPSGDAAVTPGTERLPGAEPHRDLQRYASSRVAAFDLDGTLVVPKTGGAWAQHRDDWQWFDHSAPDGSRVVSTLQRLHREGYRLVLFTNQKGVSVGKQTVAEMRGRIENVMRAIHVPMLALAATADDLFRKPRPGMWDVLQRRLHWGTPIDASASLYVGDAAGRPAQGKSRKKDHSWADRRFADNVGLPFYTPEAFFRGVEEALPPDTAGFQPRLLPLAAAVQAAEEALPAAPTGRPEVVVLVGSPAAGKSTWVRRHFADYAWVNQDTLKTKAKCVAAVRAALAKGQAAVVDNTNRDVATRAAYIQAAHEAGVPVRCLFFEQTKELAFHLNAFRAIRQQITGTGTDDDAETGSHPQQHAPGPGEDCKRVPDMVIHAFFKNLQAPTVAEGFTEVGTVAFAAGPFGSAEERRLFFMKLEG